LHAAARGPKLPPIAQVGGRSASRELLGMDPLIIGPNVLHPFAIAPTGLCNLCVYRITPPHRQAKRP